MPLKIPPRILPSSLLAQHGLSSSLTSTFLLPSKITIPRRTYASSPQKKNPGQARKKPQRAHFRQYDLSEADQFSLYDAVRYLRAVEVGQDPHATKYELAVKLHAQKNGPTVKNRIKLPKAVKTDMRICVIADGKFAEEAKKAGASVVGTTEVFEKIKKGEIEFEQCLCHEPSLPLLLKAGVARILGPRGLMPSTKTGTVIQNPASAVRDMTGQLEYRERLGVIRIPIGQLGFTEKELQKNIVAFMESIKKDIGALSGKTDKGIVEVVLSTTNGPGMSLSGEIRTTAPALDLSATAATATIPPPPPLEAELIRATA